MTAPIAFRKASTVAAETALRAGEFHNSLTDGEALTGSEISALAFDLAKVNNKRKSTVDASTAGYFYAAAEALLAAAREIDLGANDSAARLLDRAANSLEEVQEHIEGLFTR